MRKPRIQKADFTAENGSRFCFFCGKKICGEQETVKRPCPHVLFVSTSEGGIEYQRSDLNLGEWDGDWKTLSRLQYPNALLIIESIGPPSGLELYIGLTPNLPGKKK